MPISRTAPSIPNMPAPTMAVQSSATPTQVTTGRQLPETATLAPAALDQLMRLRDLLYDSIKRDKYGLCDFSKDPPDVFYAYGEEAECRMRHVRSHSEFRDGIHYMFRQNRQTNQKRLSDQIVEPLIKLLMTEGIMQEPNARRIVYDHYNKVYGHYPMGVIATEPAPSRVPQPVTTRDLPLPGVGPVEPGVTTMPIPTMPDDVGHGVPVEMCPPGQKMTLSGCMPCAPGDVDPQCYVQQIADCQAQGGTFSIATGTCRMPEVKKPEDEFPWMWVGIGVGAAVLLGGVYYFATRDKGAYRPNETKKEYIARKMRSGATRRQAEGWWSQTKGAKTAHKRRMSRHRKIWGEYNEALRARDRGEPVSEAELDRLEREAQRKWKKMYSSGRKLS